VACYVNGRNCGRIHCKIDGALLPLLSVLGLVNLLRVTSLSWAGYTDVLTGVVILSFVVEYINTRLRDRERSASVR